MWIFTTPAARRWKRAHAELLRMYRETCSALQANPSVADQIALTARLGALEDAQDALLFARHGLHAPAVRQERSRVGVA